MSIIIIINNRVREIDEYSGNAWPARVKYVVYDYQYWDGCSFRMATFFTRAHAEDYVNKGQPWSRQTSYLYIEEELLERSDYQWMLLNTLSNLLLDEDKWWK